MTDEQAATWASIVGVEVKNPKKQKPIAKWNDSPTPVEKYMEHCLFWIKEYKEGNCTQEKAKSAARSMIEHCRTIINEPELNKTHNP